MKKLSKYAQCMKVQLKGGKMKGKSKSTRESIFKKAAHFCSKKTRK